MHAQPKPTVAPPAAPARPPTPVLRHPSTAAPRHDGESSLRWGAAPRWWSRGLRPVVPAAGRSVERRWRWPLLLALGLTIPAFYAELLHREAPLAASLAYALAAAVVLGALLHVGLAARTPRAHLRANPLDLLLVPGLLAAAVLPSSQAGPALLMLRLVVALLTLTRMVWAMRQLLSRGSLLYLLLSAALVLVACGVGFWWLEPRTPTLGDGLWLAFTTAATVGYGDVVPSTPASKIFSVFVVMLGFGVLSLVTAAIATQWVETEERTIEREILRDMHRQMDGLRAELQALRELIAQTRPPAAGAPTAPAGVSPDADADATAPVIPGPRCGAAR